MQKFKGLFWIGGTFAVFILLISLLIPSRILTVRSVVVHGTETDIAYQLGHFENWKNWHPVFMQTTAQNISVPDSGVGASLQWKQHDEPYMLQFTKTQQMQFAIALKDNGKPDVENLLTINKVQENNAYQVEWSVITHLRWYPWEKFGGIFLEKMTGPGYEAALQSLQQYIEQTKGAN